MSKYRCACALVHGAKDSMKNVRMDAASPELTGWGRLKQQSRGALTYRGRELMAYASYYGRPQPDDQVRVVIFAQGRTGSTLLESLLASTGYFKLNGELLNTDSGEALLPSQFVRGLSKQIPENFNIHVKVYQWTRDRKHPVDPVDFLSTLHEEGWRVIYLRRENKVQHALSNIVAEARGQYHKQNDTAESLRLHIDPDNFIEAIRDRIRFEEHERQVLQNVDYHEVVYETDLLPRDAQQNTANHILDFLELERRSVTTPHRKVNTTPITQLITNYDEIQARLAENNWAHFLDE